MSAADKPSEYLKRTCLICGCNTNQTINIYEPRGGPNIVQLIQAKFKFQPLNEDKYLCFSCNNWLINWHSLQANNSNDAESPSGTFRSSQVNGGMAQEKRANQSQQQRQHQQYPLHQQQQEKSIGICRPMAYVRPQQMLQNSTTEANILKQHQSLFTTPLKKVRRQKYAKKRFNGTYRLHRICIKQFTKCYGCRCPIVLRIRGATGIQKPKRTVKCRKCRINSNQLRSFQKYKNLTKEQNNNIIPTTQTLVNTTCISSNISTGNQSKLCVQTQSNQSQSLKRPLVDGKVVSMLRRLGTTLSRQCSDEIHTKYLPPIMSPTKPKPQWTRQLEDDEILLNFDTAISEVLPIVVDKMTRSKQEQIRRKLTYQISCEPNNVNEVNSSMTAQDKKEVQMNCEIQREYNSVLSSLPKGLDILLM